jgi:hypothetical protein
LALKNTQAIVTAKKVIMQDIILPIKVLF